MRFVAGGVALMLVLAGCSSRVRLPERTPRNATMFGPTSMRIHPIFTQVKDWTGDGKPDGIEALIEFQDRFGDPTKASGSAIFELFEYRAYNPDPRGERVTGPWTGSLLTIDEQRARWNRTLSTYSFRLPFEHVRDNRNYVLAATFDRSAGAGEANRFFDRIVLEAAQRKEPTTGDDDELPATRPVAP
ncbi:MAG TPA: hypothetical protein VGR35_19765 [Tepidisphaeraceae bacterium]|nr:hypothetical protein [Tepidisphaeraceae bacterium]